MFGIIQDERMCISQKIKPTNPLYSKANTTYRGIPPTSHPNLEKILTVGVAGAVVFSLAASRHTPFPFRCNLRNRGVAVRGRSAG